MIEVLRPCFFEYSVYGIFYRDLLSPEYLMVLPGWWFDKMILSHHITFCHSPTYLTGITMLPKYSSDINCFVC